jgi:hypothetical protein
MQHLKRTCSEARKSAAATLTHGLETARTLVHQQCTCGPHPRVQVVLLHDELQARNAEIEALKRDRDGLRLQLLRANESAQQRGQKLSAALRGKELEAAGLSSQLTAAEERVGELQSLLDATLVRCFPTVALRNALTRVRTRFPAEASYMHPRRLVRPS